MDSSQLEAFIAIAQILNFTKAAEHLHISQSAITARIKALEAAVGKELFQRDNRNVSLTRAGIAFYPYAERMLRLFEESKLTLSDSFEQSLVLSGPGSVWHYWYLPRILAFRRDNPQVAVKFLSNIDPGYMIRDLLLDGMVHLSIKFDPPEHPKVIRQLLFEDEILLVSRQPRARKVEKEDFRSADYCHNVWGSSFPEWFAELVGPGYVPALETDHSTIMLTILLQGEGFGFLPRSIAQPHLDSHSLFELPCAFDMPSIRAYATYLTDQQHQGSVQLGLKLLGLS
ncbi:DNA-binding transcriptional regulator, LysR family [Paenibacillus catalpae]|uniref:DNA-binding transcriptional regulator, LysR family n=1 Tax=Paenibacillus catalpae TaxID=1045775 RepID=A0A1I2E792_9BACL|nr:LysR family transcriptional regulator [Paenibacillus catalpae]SFE88577.1 DNA-binding transcriptional regulator, LysR family [Paenibacillus catalpae]